MIEDDFYATVKFKSGEEVFAKVSSSEEEEGYENTRKTRCFMRSHY